MDRIGYVLASMLLAALLAGCGGSDPPAAVGAQAPDVGGAAPDPEPTPAGPPAVPAGVAIAYDIKTFQLTWGAVAAPAGSGPVTYRVLEDEDGPGPKPSAVVADGLPTPHYTRVVPGRLDTRLNARYAVQACNDIGCSPASLPASADVNQAIGYLKASNTQAGDLFGYSLAISRDGSTIAVAALYEDSAATGIGGDQGDDGALQSGAVYVYARSGGGWVQQAYVKASNTDAGDHFGKSIALSGDGNTLAVAAGSEASGNGDPADNSLLHAGAVYVFTRSGSTWSQQAYVKADLPGPDLLGGYVDKPLALSDDGNTLAVGAPWEDSSAAGVGADPSDNGAADAGAAYVFVRAGGTWSQQAYIKASNPGAGDLFGNSLALSADGNTLAVGAPSEGSAATGVGGNQADNSVTHAGAVYVFVRSGAAWSQQAYIKSSTPVLRYFGLSVALSADGDTLAAGAFADPSGATGIDGDDSDTSAPSSGAVYVFARSGAAWAQQAYVKPPVTASLMNFGRAFALASDGGTLAVGAPGQAMEGRGIEPGALPATAPSSGAVYVYARDGTTWAGRAYLKASNGRAGSLFGSSVALSGDGGLLAVSALQETSASTGIGGDASNTAAMNAGAVFLY